ncbi:hypothetical protein AAGS40_23395 [Paraburkholderia sp. PREW-6R]|uniref:hypothetical protein n=1 Tax=Paraburkholderia sp. PREW-6R TaxID=3141544 RepID=UPI0031F5C67F
MQPLLTYRAELIASAQQARSVSGQPVPDTETLHRLVADGLIEERALRQRFVFAFLDVEGLRILFAHLLDDTVEVVGGGVAEQENVLRGMHF